MRLYKRHLIRKTCFLDGIWQFKPDEAGVGEKEEWYKNELSGEDIICPSCWNNKLGYYHYEGVFWYQKRFRTEKQFYRIICHAVSGYSKVYIDGVMKCEHYGGFTPFKFDMDLSFGEHVITIMTDNTHNDINTIPLSRVDWFHYGGIFKSVEIQALESSYINNFKLDYQLSEDLSSAEITLTADVFGDERLEVFLDNKLIDSLSPPYNLKTALTDITLWDTENPKLYELRLKLSDKDDIIEKIGFRRIEIKDGKLQLNNKELVLKGVNRHEEHPDFGFSVPEKLMEKDIDIIKDLGCNTVRGSHYPNSEAFLDFCDLNGILFWEEIPMWQYSKECMSDELMISRGLTMHKEMIERDYHHPSIIIWGLHNEVDTDTKECYELTKRFYNLIKDYDDSRLITYASYRSFTDICMEFADFFSINRYIGWYGGEMSEWENYLEELFSWLDNTGNKGKPVVISEFGAGGIYGERSFEMQKWSEDFQAYYLDTVLPVFKKYNRIIGTYVWQFCDIRTAKEMELIRPRSFNNKGILNEYRKPKLAYNIVKKHYK